MARAIFLDPRTWAALVVVAFLAWAGAALHGAGRDAGREEVQPKLEACQEALRTAVAAHKSQSAAIAAQAAEDAKRLAQAQADLDAAMQGQSASTRRIATLSRPVAGADQCVRLVTATERVREVFK